MYFFSNLRYLNFRDRNDPLNNIPIGPLYLGVFTPDTDHVRKVTQPGNFEVRNGGLMEKRLIEQKLYM